MNVLPAPPPTTDRPAPGRSSAGAADTSGFAQLLAGHVDGDACPATAEPARGGHDEGEVAAAVHAAIAAWRADPADVALGAHLRRVLHETVAGHADTAAVADAPTGHAPVVDAAASAGASPAGGRVAAATEAMPAPLPTSPDDVAVPADPTVPAPDAGDAAADDPAPVPRASGEPAVPATSATPAVPATPGVVAPRGEHVEPVAPPTPTTPARPAVPATPATPATRAVAPPRRPDPAPTHPDADAVDVALEVGDPAPSAPTVDRTVAPAPRSVAASAALERVLQAVEALEHAPPPRRMAIEVEGVQLTVAMQGDDVQVVVRGGGDQLSAGWQRELASALRDRGLGLAGEGAASGRDGRGGSAHDGRPDARPLAASRATHVRPRPADAGLRL